MVVGMTVVHTMMAVLHTMMAVLHTTMAVVNTMMAVLAFGFSADIADFIGAWLPFKGAITSGIFFLAFSQVDNSYLSWY